MFHFVVHNGAGSALIRGHQMSSVLGTCFLDELRPATVTVFVKWCPVRSVLESARQCSEFVVYDPVDRYNFRGVCRELIDGVIASNKAHAQWLGQHFPAAICEVIPHHHCVLPGVIPGECPEKSGVVGYVGELDNLAIDPRDVCRRFPDFLYGSDMALLPRIGIGMAFRAGEKNMTFKSGVKLANYWAHGIAAVVSPDSSYLEMGQDGVNMLLAHSKEQLLDNIALLKGDDELRKRLSSMGFSSACKYDLASVSKMYYTLLEHMRCRRG